jgi:hypothetical protein
MLPWLVLALLFLATARFSTADLAGGVAGVPFVGPMLVPPPATPAYLQAMGTPAPIELPEPDFAAWFPAEGGWQRVTPAAWQAMALAATVGGTPAGWAELCAKASAAAGQDRASAPLPGALACSDDPTVTGIQRIPLKLFDLRASLGLWLTGAPNGSIGAIQARQAALRLLCATTAPGRLDRQELADACARGLDASYLEGDGAATIAEVEAAYAALAAAIATLDPTTDPAPATFDPAAGP